MIDHSATLAATAQHKVPQPPAGGGAGAGPAGGTLL